MSDTCRIRPMQYADLPMVLAWRNHADVRRYMINQHQISMSEHQAWFLKASENPERCLLIVEESDTPLGFVQFTNVSLGGVADWGFYSYPGALKGTGRKIGVTALHYAFFTLRLHKVCGQSFEFNEKSITFHKRLGFAQEGILREQHKISGEYHNLICFGLLRSEWSNS